MTVNKLLQLSIWLVGLCLARHTPTPVPSTVEGGGQVPVSQLQVLSVGLVHLINGVHESSGRVGGQVERVAEELEANSRAVERLRGLGVQVGRTHRQVRKDLQVLRAQGDKLERAAQNLKQELGAAVVERENLELRMSRVLERVKRVTEPFSGTDTRLNMSLLKVIMDTQSIRLAELAAEVMTREQMIDRNLQHIVDLEEQVSISGGRE